VPESPHYRGSDGKVYIMPWGTNARRQRRPYAGAVEGCERFARPSGRYLRRPASLDQTFLI
jgi:hypothetical protein